MSTDHDNNNVQHIPYQAFMLAPMFAPLTWLLAAAATNLYARGLSLAAFGMKFLFMLLLLLGSYALCTPLLHIWAGILRKPRKSRYAGFVFAAITALALGVLYAQPRFQDARHLTQNLVYLAFMLLTCLGMFMSLKNLFPSGDRNNRPACLVSISKHPSVWGLFSILKGVLALLIICPTIYVNSLRNFDFSHLLDFSYKKGGFAEEVFAVSIFDINPGHFLAWCFYSAIILAVAAMATALQAKIRGEDSLYRAIGCTVGALSLAVFDPKLAVYAGLAYGVASYGLELKTGK